MNCNIQNNLLALLSFDAIKQLATNQNISMPQYYALTSFLIKQCIPFDTEYSAGSPRTASAMQITIYLSPSIQLVLNITSDPGASLFNYNSSSSIN